MPRCEASNKVLTETSEKIASVFWIVPASLYIFSATGDMIKIVRISEIPVITWFGGTCCVPSALRRIDKTTAILTNDVSMIKPNGASASAPTTMIKTTGFAVSAGFAGFAGAVSCARPRTGKIPIKSIV